LDDLWHVDCRVLHQLLRNPGLLLELFDEALLGVQQTMQELGIGGSASCVKRNAHVRMEGLPRTVDLCKPNISSIRNTDSGRMIQIQGTVVRSGMLKMLEVSRKYQCQNKVSTINEYTMKTTISTTFNCKIQNVCKRLLLLVRALERQPTALTERHHLSLLLLLADMW
jgi:DNA replicative helicase MCM subunit Mcm2 (Cdc46/Mcm family)